MSYRNHCRYIFPKKTCNGKQKLDFLQNNYLTEPPAKLYKVTTGWKPCNNCIYHLYSVEQNRNFNCNEFELNKLIVIQ